MKDADRERETVVRIAESILETPGATYVSRLSDGPTNSSHRVGLGDDEFVLRLDTLEAARLGLDRRNELRIVKALAEAGLAPAPLYFEPGQGVYLRRYLAGRCWTDSDLQRADNLERLARLLGKLHALAPVGERFDPLAAARRYAAHLDRSEAQSVLNRLQVLAGERSGHPAGQALCHNDLVCQNIFEGEHLMLIDWEYAGVGDPFFDLAVIVQHHGLSLDLKNGFLMAYLGRTATPEEKAHLDLQCEFYAALLKLWTMRVGP